MRNLFRSYKIHKLGIPAGLKDSEIQILESLESRISKLLKFQSSDIPNTSKKIFYLEEDGTVITEIDDFQPTFMWVNKIVDDVNDTLDKILPYTEKCDFIINVFNISQKKNIQSMNYVSSQQWVMIGIEYLRNSLKEMILTN